MGRFPFEDKVHSRSVRWALIVCLAFVVYIACEAGRLAGLPLEGLNISIIWPAAGVALAAILLYGYRISLGILLGCMAYNIPHLLVASSSPFIPILIGTLISAGSTLQALTAAFIIRNLSTPNLFNNLKDIFVFLIPGTLIAHTIACSISVPLLAMGGFIDWSQAGFIWLTFWIGDSTGVIVFTPFLVVWSTAKSWAMAGRKVFEALLILAIFAAIAYSTFYLDYPLTHLIIPLVLWVTFRFGKLGATLTIIVTAVLAITTTTMGYGLFLHINLAHPETVLVSFIDVVAATALILAGALAEREDAWDLLQNYNRNLEETVNLRTKQLNDIHDAFNVKQKLISLGMLTAGIGHEIKNPLNKIKEFAQGGEDCLDVLHTTFIAQKNKLDPSSSGAMENTLESLQNCMKKIGEYESQANKIVDVIIQTASTERSGSSELKAINLHVLLNKALEQTRHNLETSYPDFFVDIKKEYSQTVSMIDGIPEDLSRVFFQIIDNSLYALREKKSQIGESFHPMLLVRTADRRDKVEIDIYDNGTGIPPEMLNKVFQPFFTTKPAGEGTGLGLAIIHDIVVQEHQGKISIDSKEGQHTEVKILLPKSHQLKAEG